MSSYDELVSISEISKQLTEVQDTIDKMKDVVGIFNLNKVLVDQLADQANTIQDSLFQDANTIRMIMKREKTFPLPTDSMTRRACEKDILEQVRDYKQSFLPTYQKMVEQLLDKKDEIKNKVAEKRQNKEEVPSEDETKNALEDAEKKLQEAVKESPRLQKTFNSVKSFVEKAKPYVEPLVAAAKIALKLLAV